MWPPPKNIPPSHILTVHAKQTWAQGTRNHFPSPSPTILANATFRLSLQSTVPSSFIYFLSSPFLGHLVYSTCGRLSWSQSYLCSYLISTACKYLLRSRHQILACPHPDTQHRSEFKMESYQILIHLCHRRNEISCCPFCYEQAFVLLCNA